MNRKHRCAAALAAIIAVTTAHRPLVAAPRDIRRITVIVEDRQVFNEPVAEAQQPAGDYAVVFLGADLVAFVVIGWPIELRHGYQIITHKMLSFLHSSISFCC